jgi:hypothetical protein
LLGRGTIGAVAAADPTPVIVKDAVAIPPTLPAPIVALPAAVNSILTAVEVLDVVKDPLTMMLDVFVEKSVPRLANT